MNRKQKVAPQKVAAITPEEQAIASRVATAGTEWETISEDDLNDFSLMTNPMDLPPECATRQERHEYAYRWAEIDPRRIDELRNAPGPLRWEVVNRTTAPYLPGDKFDPVHGAVQVLDQILMYKPWRMFQAVQAAKQKMADSSDASGNIKKRDGTTDERGAEYFSGPDHKIGGTDHVVADEAALDTAMGVKEDNSGLGDLVVNE